MKLANAVMLALAAEAGASRLASHTSAIWTTASEAIVNSHQSIQRAASSTILPAVKWAVSHPGTTATCGTAGLGMVLTVAPAAAAAPALGALGLVMRRTMEPAPVGYLHAGCNKLVWSNSHVTGSPNRVNKRHGLGFILPRANLNFFFYFCRETTTGSMHRHHFNRVLNPSTNILPGSRHKTTGHRWCQTNKSESAYFIPLLGTK